MTSRIELQHTMVPEKRVRLRDDRRPARTQMTKLGVWRAVLAVVAGMASTSALAVTTFTYTGTLTTYTVPATGVYRISAAGAQGGSTQNNIYSSNKTGGLGALMTGSVSLVAGQTLAIVVGGQGQEGGTFGVGGTDPGGGGGTFVTVEQRPASHLFFLPLVVAGGGGGGGYANGAQGGPGLIGEGGGNGRDVFLGGCGGTGGWNGDGGSASSITNDCADSYPYGNSGGGGGYYTDGGGGQFESGVGGKAFYNGAAGGSAPQTVAGSGGFGGGGSGGNDAGEGGGGGGFSGGGGGGDSGGGGGGGSYFTSDPEFAFYDGYGQQVQGLEFAQAGVNAGDGFASIEFYQPIVGVPEPTSWTLLIAGIGLTGAAMRRRRLVPAAARS